MRQSTVKAAVSSIAIAALLAGCGGGGSSAPVPPSGGNGPATLSYVLKVSPQSSIAKAVRTRHYTSRDAIGVGLRGGPHPTVFPNTVAGLRDYTANGFAFTLAPGQTHTPTTANDGSESCTGAASDGSFTCTFGIPGVQAGYIDGQITLWNAHPTAEGSGTSFPGAALPLGVGVISNAVILSGQTNVLGASIGGVVDSVQLQLNPSLFIIGGGTQNATMTAVAKDAAGDIIIGNDQYLDNGGNSLTLTMAAAPAHFSYPGSSTFNNPSQTVAVQYDGGGAAGTAQFTLSTVLTGLKGAATATTTSTGSGGSLGVPGHPTVNTAGGSAPFNDTSAEAVDTNGNVWVGTFTAISELQQAGHTFAGGSVTAALPGNVVGMATAANGFICFVMQGNAQIGCFDPTAASPITPTYAPLTGPGIAITLGPGSDMWVAEQSAGRVADVSVSAGPTVTVNSNVDVSANETVPTALTLGPDANLWVVDQFNNKLMTLSAGPSYTQTLVHTGAPLSSPDGIVTGPDNNIWVTNGAASNNLIKVSPGSPYAMTTYSVAGVTPSGLIVGYDGNFWFNDSTNNQIAVASPANGTILQAFPLGAGVTLAAYNMVSNPIDNNIYVQGNNAGTYHTYYFKP